MSAIRLTEKNEVAISLEWLLGSLTGEQKRQLIDTLSCQNEIIEDVCAQLLHGMTSLGSSGPDLGGQVDPTTPLAKARMEIALNANDVATREINALRRSLIWAKAMEDRYCVAYFSLSARLNYVDFHVPALSPMPLSLESEYEVIRRATP